MSAIIKERSIRSYKNRGSKLDLTKQNLFDKFWPIYGIEATELQRKFFSDNKIKTVEIGFGDGENLFTQAKNFPKQNFLGIEVYSRGIVSLLSKLNNEPLSNIKICLGDAEMLFADHIPNQCIDTLNILFPDPWPKLRHHKRRIIKDSFIQNVANTMRVNGILHLATDWEDYAKYMIKILEKNPRFNLINGNFEKAERPSTRIMTKYERRGLNLGYKTWDFIYQCIPNQK